MDEGRMESTIADLALDIVASFRGQVNLTNEKGRLSVPASDSCEEDRSVFIVISGEEMSM
jgi:hypothetical protein